MFFLKSGLMKLKFCIMKSSSLALIIATACLAAAESHHRHQCHQRCPQFVIIYANYHHSLPSGIAGKITLHVPMRLIAPSKRRLTGGNDMQNILSGIVGQFLTGV